MTKFTEDFTHKLDACFQCNGYYGPNFSQPLCTTCHAFLYPDDASKLPSVGPHQEKTDDGDSGNEEPREPADYYQTQEQVQQQPQQVQQQQYQLHQVEQPLQQQQGQQQQQDGSTDTNDLVANQAENDDFDFVEGAGADSMDDGSDLVSVSVVESSVTGTPSAGHSAIVGQLPMNIAGTSGIVNIGGIGSISTGPVAGVSVPVTSSTSLLPIGTSGRGLAGQNVSDRSGIKIACIYNGRLTVERETLQEQINQLTCPRPRENLDPALIHRMPPEVWVLVFDLLDDMTLWSVGRVCRRWQQLVDRYVADDEWQKYTQRRWPLFKPLFENVQWQLVYTKLTESAPCHMCLHQMSLLTPPLNNENSWRRNRLRNELRTLRSDPPEGIQASPLDKMSLHWQASIRGPGGSPYEGGTFFLYIQIPHSYPLCPPIVRFITKIFHPNVSRHGDIGIDSIQHNWSLALTISKVLISIQSLLTDPYTKVCMEPEIGRLYDSDKKLFECVAKVWTWNYAMHDALIPGASPTSSISHALVACGSTTQGDQEEGPSTSRTGTDTESRIPFYLT